MFDDTSKSRLDKIVNPLLTERGISLWIKREDLLHEEVSGNKWRKLKYNFLEAKNKGYDSVLTYGGAYSNHLLATAAAAHEHGFKSIGIVRGDELKVTSNATLQRCHALGMHLKFVSRSDYKQKNDPGVLMEFTREFGKCYSIPEGGSNLNAVRGCQDVIGEIDQQFDYIVTAVGTGGTLAGLTSGLAPNQKALGVSVLKNATYLEEEISKLLNEYNEEKSFNWKINHEYHLGGYAKFNVGLVEFINKFRQDFDVQLDPVYTGKMMFGLFDMIKRDYFLKETKIIAMHTGGIQGIRGFNERHGGVIQTANA